MTSKYNLTKIRRRLEWLQEKFYKPIQEIQLQIGLTDSYREFNERDSLKYELIENNTSWGKPWGSAWFWGEYTVELPLLALLENNERILLQTDTGGESLVYLDGHPIGALDRHHKEIMLRSKELAAGNHEIFIQSYAGHNIPSSRPIPSELVAANWRQPAYKHCRLVKRNEAAWNLYFDLTALLFTALELPEDSLRRIKIIQKLTAVLDSIIWETQDTDLQNDQFVEARKKVTPLLALKNSETTPLINLIGHSHIDVAYLWPINETIRKCGRTFSTQLRLIDEYPLYIFLQSQAQVYAYVEKHYPELFIKIKHAIAQEKWEVNGGTWVEPDTNLPSAESLIRQFLLGQAYFLDKFNVRSCILWLPDTFGYSGNLPQIMKGCGVDYFITSKIGWNDTNRFPHDLFRWRGIDGTEVLTFLIKNTFDRETRQNNLWQNWREFHGKENTDTILDTVGYGDGGGGITMEQLEYLARVKDLEGLPKVEFGFAGDFMKGLDQESGNYPVHVGELYLEYHRGTYTSQAWTKRNNRKIEFLVREMEYIASLADIWLDDYNYPSEKLNLLWQEILTAQFHDILPGSSINKVYQDCNAMYSYVAQELDQLVTEAMGNEQSTADKIEKTPANPRCAGLNILVSNTLNWDFTEPITVYFEGADLLHSQIGDYALTQPLLDPKLDHVVLDGQGKVLPSQRLEDRLVFLPGRLPQLSITNFSIAPAGEDTPPAANAVVVGRMESEIGVLENEFLRVKVNRHGQLISVFDKQTLREILTKASANLLLVAEDLPNEYDAWNIDPSYAHKAQSVQMGSQVSLVASGPIEARLRVVGQIGESSSYTQDIILRAESRRIDFPTKVYWQEKHRILKVSFPVKIYSSQADYEIPGGYLSRATHKNTSWDKARSEVCGHKWADLSEPDYGVALLNDSKYGYEIIDNDIRLTLLKSAMAPDPLADQGVHNFVYSLYPHLGNQVEAKVAQKGYELNNAPRVYTGLDENAEHPLQTWVMVGSDEVWLQACKKAEDNTGYILRFNELAGKNQMIRIMFRVKVTEILQTNMLEQESYRLDIENGGLACQLHFHPFEIKTIKVVLDI